MTFFRTTVICNSLITLSRRALFSSKIPEQLTDVKARSFWKILEVLPSNTWVLDTYTDTCTCFVWKYWYCAQVLAHLCVLRPCYTSTCSLCERKLQKLELRFLHDLAISLAKTIAPSARKSAILSCKKNCSLQALFFTPRKKKICELVANGNSHFLD